MTIRSDCPYCAPDEACSFHYDHGSSQGEERTMTTTQQAIPANQFDATNRPVFSVYAPHFKSSRLIARNVTYPRARQIAKHHGAFVFHTADLAYFQPEPGVPS